MCLYCLYWHSTAVQYIHCITTRTFHMVYNERVYYCVTASPLHLLPRSIHSYCQCPPPMLKLGKRTHKCSTAQHFKSFSFSTLHSNPSIYSLPTLSQLCVGFKQKAVCQSLQKCSKQKILQHIIQLLSTLHYRGGQQAATIRVLRHARVVIRWPEVDQLAAESLISLPAHCQSTLWEHTRPPSYLYKLISLSRPYGMQGIFLVWEILKSHTSSSNIKYNISSADSAHSHPKCLCDTDTRPQLCWCVESLNLSVRDWNLPLTKPMAARNFETWETTKSLEYGKFLETGEITKSLEKSLFKGLLSFYCFSTLSVFKSV